MDPPCVPNPLTRTHDPSLEVNGSTHSRVLLSIWSPYKQSEISALESIQWSFIRKISGSYPKDYWETLKWLNLYSLQRRRERYQIIYVWKIIVKLVPDFESDQKAIEHYVSPRRGRLCKLPSVLTKIPKSSQTKMYGSLSHFGPRLFNGLPRHLRGDHSGDANSFKRLLDRFLASIPDEPSLPGHPKKGTAD